MSPKNKKSGGSSPTKSPKKSPTKKPVAKQLEKKGTGDQKNTMSALLERKK